MAFTALHPTRGRLDGTRDDLGVHWSWTAIHRSRPELACVECGHSMRAECPLPDLRFFAHTPGAPACSLSSRESIEHHVLKQALAQAARSAGHHVDLEASSPGEGMWRTDVLVTSQDGNRRTALEVQDPPITTQDILRRSRAYRRDGINVAWFTTCDHGPLCVDNVPTVRIEAPADPSAEWLLPAAHQRLTTTECRCGPSWDHPLHLRWSAHEPILLSEFLKELLTGRLIHHTQLEARTGRRFRGWAKTRDAQTDADHLERLAATTTAGRMPLFLNAATDAAHDLSSTTATGEASDLGRLLDAARRWGHRSTGTSCHLEVSTANWLAGGLILTPTRRQPGSGATSDSVTAVVRPHPSRINWDGPLCEVPVLVGSAEEFFTLKRAAPPAAQILVV
ncbi:competence protein CoiA family protein [Streptomyces sp. NPDC001933]|uniref:competence protein CoiA family protein n=1 Tax=Streptomyces sp. NPDC001933 TaxID=3364626 RepID=UPI0036B1920A